MHIAGIYERTEYISLLVVMISHVLGMPLNTETEPFLPQLDGLRISFRTLGDHIEALADNVNGLMMHAIDVALLHAESVVQQVVIVSDVDGMGAAAAVFEIAMMAILLFGNVLNQCAAADDIEELQSTADT